jgi:hypothetical protein
MRNVSAKAEIMYYDLDRCNMGGIEADAEMAGFVSTIAVRPREHTANRLLPGASNISH